MEKIIEKYNEFKANEAETWKNRFTWCGLDGKNPKYTISYPRFFKEVDVEKVFPKSKNSADLFDNVAKLADVYVDWVKSKGTPYTRKEYEDMCESFKGAMGEFFFYNLLNDVKCITIPDTSDGTYNRFDFNFVSPTLKSEKDFGIDLTGLANDVPSVFQVKFWNPFGRQPLTIDIFQKADSEGTRNGYINQEENNNIFVCWLGTEERGVRYLNENKAFKNKALIIGWGALDSSINNRNTLFWDGLYEKMIKIADFV